MTVDQPKKEKKPGISRLTQLSIAGVLPFKAAPLGDEIFRKQQNDALKPILDKLNISSENKLEEAANATFEAVGEYMILKRLDVKIGSRKAYREEIKHLIKAASTLAQLLAPAPSNTQQAPTKQSKGKKSRPKAFSVGLQQMFGLRSNRLSRTSSSVPARTLPLNEFDSNGIEAFARQCERSWSKLLDEPPIRKYSVEEKLVGNLGRIWDEATESKINSSDKHARSGRPMPFTDFVLKVFECINTALEKEQINPVAQDIIRRRVAVIVKGRCQDIANEDFD